MIYFSHKDITLAAEVIQQDLLNIDKWMDSNKLTINIKKTQYMVISSHAKKYDDIDLTIKNDKLLRTKAYKYLGVRIDQHLNYSQHINYLAGTVKNKIRTISRLSHYMPKSINIMLYKALVLPHLDYGSAIWGSASATLLANLQDLQTKTLAKLLKMKGGEEKEVHILAKIQTLQQRRDEQLLISIFNILVLRHDSYLLEELQTLNHGHNTRNNQALHLPKPNTNYLKRTITYRGIQLWNSTVHKLKNFDSKSSLKLSFRLYCLNQ